MRAICVLLGFACLVVVASTTTTTTSVENIVLTANNHIAFLGPVTEASVSVWMQSLYEKVKPGAELYVYLNSPGGQVDAGMHLITQMRHLRRTYNMTLRCLARRAASMAFAIYQLGCDERLLTDTATLMQHQASYGVEGNERTVRNRQALYRKQIAHLTQQQAERLGVTVD